jgi:hypothetical protein
MITIVGIVKDVGDYYFTPDVVSTKDEFDGDLIDSLRPLEGELVRITIEVLDLEKCPEKEEVLPS